MIMAIFSQSKSEKKGKDVFSTLRTKFVLLFVDGKYLFAFKLS